MLRVKIVCTIGPASRDEENLSKMILGGMNVARLNMSHGTHEYHRGTIELLRKLSYQLDKPIAILADLQGPKLRVGKMQVGGVRLEEEETLILTNDEIVGVVGRVPVQYTKLPGLVRPGERILLDDGLLELEVLAKTENEIRTQVIVGGILHDNKGINLPDASLGIPAITDKDRDDVRFALEQGVDWIAFSFVRTASEVVELKSIIRDLSPPDVMTPVISKIEKPDAVKNIDDIIAESDGIMVARGDLGIETSPEAVPIVQKQIIAKCHRAAKPVITATQMLDSMIRNPRPTRAEASDVANAVLDGTDAIMLSGETAAGIYPVQAVETMARIAREAERTRNSAMLDLTYGEPDIFTAAGAVCHATIQTAADINAAAIIAPTVTGNTAKLISAFRPGAPVIAITPNERAHRQLCLYWGTYPLVTKEIFNTTDEVIEDAMEIAQKHGYVQTGDMVVITGGMAGPVRRATNLMTVRTIESIVNSIVIDGEKRAILSQI
ncbi:pyruvate kinase [Chloroflexi bacterium TSY]|nr:pyruvate kinase [Chloroflexi bacterium TSY]